ncbi:MAG: hypothetical protein Q8P67_22895 [archaeon]|nr:hypothetical protein [archaeon]
MFWFTPPDVKQLDVRCGPFLDAIKMKKEERERKRKKKKDRKRRERRESRRVVWVEFLFRREKRGKKQPDLGTIILFGSNVKIRKDQCISFR